MKLFLELHKMREIRLLQGESQMSFNYNHYYNYYYYCCYYCYCLYLSYPQFVVFLDKCDFISDISLNYFYRLIRIHFLKHYNTLEHNLILISERTSDGLSELPAQLEQVQPFLHSGETKKTKTYLG